MTSVIFAGPSVTRADREGHSEVTFEPPAQRGDVLRILHQNPGGQLMQIGLIDGYFDDRPAVLHKELLEAMSLGVCVYGAASMGALRASELHPYGMIGVGAVFEGYQSGRLTRDADVAVSHGPEELGFPLLTVPQVDVVATARALEQSAQLSRQGSAHIIETSGRIFYKNRTWAHLVERVGPNPVAPQRLLHMLQAKHVEAKRLDAIELLERMKEDRNQSKFGPRYSTNRPPLTLAFRRVRDCIVASELAQEEQRADQS